MVKIRYVFWFLLSSTSLFYGCSVLNRYAWPPNLLVTSQVFSLAESNYVEILDFAKLRVGAMSGLAKQLPPGAFLVHDGHDELTITYRSTGGSLMSKTF